MIKKGAVKKLSKVLSYIAITVLIFVGILTFLIVDTHSPLTQSFNVNSNTAKHSNNLLARLKHSINQSLQQHKKTNFLMINEHELKALAAILSRSDRRLNADFKLTQHNLNAQFSWLLPINFTSLFINTSMTLLPSTQGLRIKQVNIGDLSFSGDIFLWLLRKSLNVMSDELGTQLLQSINGITIQQKMMVVNYQFPQTLANNSFSHKSTLLLLRDELALFGDTYKIRFYYRHLLHLINQGKAPKQLTVYVKQMINLAINQTMLNNNAKAKEENQAALLALAVYFGSPKFELLIGDISHLSKQERLKRKRLIKRVHLAKRSDLQQHYIYSMALQIFASIGVSNTIGELKELLDSNAGGSGFSFADLTADRAGARLALLATSSEASARQFQQNFLVNAQSLRLIPEVIDLPEGITEQQFEQAYHNVNSQTYQQMLALIDQRINALPMYQVVNNAIP